MNASWDINFTYYSKREDKLQKDDEVEVGCARPFKMLESHPKAIIFYFYTCRVT